MDSNIYALEWLVRSKLAAARAESARGALLASLRAGRPGVLVTVGLALIRIGRWLNRGRRARRRAAGFCVLRLPSP